MNIFTSWWLDKPIAKRNVKTNLHVTLSPEFPHFARFSQDTRLQGIRLNSAMLTAGEITDEFLKKMRASEVPLWFDIKGMQLRIRELICDESHDHLEFRLNRPIKCQPPCPVWFKGGEDAALLVEIRDGSHLIFAGGPRYRVKVGESLHIRQPELEVGGPVFLDFEKEKIAKIPKDTISRWYLSYVWDQRHVDEFRELIGKDADLRLKIENKKGLEFTERFKPDQLTHLVAARGDLFVELDKPHQIMAACKKILRADPEAAVGSRMLLSIVQSDVPSCADLNELAYLYEIGFREYLLCDDLCLKEEYLARALAVFEAFRKDYPE
jgi:pyruvate kinase